MTDRCRNDCLERLLFPKQVSNRPGLSRIDYRIGTYADIREALIRKLDQDPVLANWTHREADDPGIALLEGASILGDILSFYQEVYANEAFLRTAQWRESVADLIRLLGYRLSPGLAGKTTFAVEVKGDKPVVIPKGFQIKAQLEEGEGIANFESKEEVVAYPHLSRFNLYCSRSEKQTIHKGENRLEVESIVIDENTGEEARDVNSIQALELKAGDRLMLLDPDQILIISKVEQVLDRTIIEFEGSLTVDRNQTVMAYRIGRSFRHFGHNAPALTSTLDKTKTPPEVNQDETNYFRELYKTYEYYCKLIATEMPLDSEVNDLASGNRIICQGALAFKATGTGAEPTSTRLSGEITHIFYDPFTEIREIKSLRFDTLTWGNLIGACTVVILDSQLTDSVDPANIRRFKFHEVNGPKIILRAPTEWDDVDFSKTTLHYWGTYDEVLALVGRCLILQKNDEITQKVRVISTCSNFEDKLEEKDRKNSWLWPVSLEKELDAFLLQDFDEQDPKVTVYGNLVEADQGKTEKEAVLGNGDNRETFQSFKLPKAPLTYTLSKDESPPEIPELTVYVNDRRWQRVSSFFSHGANEEIYIVREDDNGDSWVQFGDGKIGARLPSGIGNITAQYRSGAGAHGPLKEGTTLQPGRKIHGLHKIQLPGFVTGGSKPETGENAKEAAPGKVQSLGRLVSLKDFETEALGIAGVVKATANWELENGIPKVILTALMESGREEEGPELQGILNEANRDRGTDRIPISVHIGKRHYCYLNILAGSDPTYRQSNLRKAIKETLGISGDEGNGIDGSRGLFGFKHRKFGQYEYATRVEGVVQNVPGVVWARVELFGFVVGDSDDPLELTLPQKTVCESVIRSSPDREETPADEVLLCLHTKHLDLNFSEIDKTEVPSHE